MTANIPDILIVDDTPDNIRFLSTMLVEQGYTVRKAINGAMALMAVKTLPPSLILLDINMPDMNGYEVCETLKKDEKTRLIPIIFLSALDDAANKVKAFLVGGADYISKPFQFAEVVARVEHQLKLHTLQQQLQVQNAQLQETLATLQTTQEQLIQREKTIALAQLVAGIAHEINNPISFIYSNIAPAREYISDLLSLIDLYQQEYPNPSDVLRAKIQEIDLEFLIHDVENLMNSMKSGADRVRTIVLGLRTFSRLDESEIKPIDIAEAIDSVLLILQHRLEQMEVVKNYSPGPKVNCYARQFNQVLFNVLDNALDALEASRENGKFRNSESPRLEITTKFLENKHLVIQIKDNGIGMTETVRQRIFDPFFTTKPVGQGRGLGLSSSYQIIVEQHQGQIQCDSVPEMGTEFTIEIPVEL